MEKIFAFPKNVEVPNATMLGSSAHFCVFSVGYLFSHSDIFKYRLLTGMCGIRLEIYDDDTDKFVGQFQYQHTYEVFSDLMRFCHGDLELEFNEDHELIGKIYKYNNQ